MKEKNYKIKYWEENIEGFSGFYDKKSEENIIAPIGVSFFYKKFIFPLEKKYMQQRHANVTEFINKNVIAEMKTADVGCGSGVYVKKMIQKKAFVYAFDFAESALELTVKNLTQEELKSAQIKQLDISKDSIPEVDIAISIGVLPYVEDHIQYLNNILPYTNGILFNFLDKNNLLNFLRRTVLKSLDVRMYSYHGLGEIMQELEKHNFNVVKKTKLATGFILEAKRK